MTISKEVINVIVDHIPETVACGAKGHPEPTFRWFREGSTETIYPGHVLVFKTTVPKRSNGTYFCEAHNRHGTRNISTYLNVQCQYRELTLYPSFPRIGRSPTTKGGGYSRKRFLGRDRSGATE